MSFVVQSKTDRIHTSLSQPEKDELYFKIMISMIQSNPATGGGGGGRYSKHFWLEECHWDSETLTLNQTKFSCILHPYTR